MPSYTPYDDHHQPYRNPPPNPNYNYPGGGFGRPIGGYPHAGQKRAHPSSATTNSPPDGGPFAKLFVGSVPKSATEEEVRPFFDKYGDVIEVALLKDKQTGQQQGPLRG